MAMSTSERPPLLQLTRCPQCGAVAEISRRIVLPSSDGPIEHLRMRCLDRHWFLLPAAAVAHAAPAPAPTPTRRPAQP
jgi:hypothetical protein